MTRWLSNSDDEEKHVHFHVSLYPKFIESCLNIVSKIEGAWIRSALHKIKRKENSEILIR